MWNTLDLISNKLELKYNSMPPYFGNDVRLWVAVTQNPWPTRMDPPDGLLVGLGLDWAQRFAGVILDGVPGERKAISTLYQSKHSDAPSSSS